MDLKGKVCLVTGGSSGIGAATALTLARKGAHVAVVARKPVPMPDCLLAAVEAHGMTARFVEADVADPEACRKCIEQVVQDFGRLDVLVHSAGGPVPGGFYAVSDVSWMNAFAVHVHSIFWCPGLPRRILRSRAGERSSSLDQRRDCAGAWAHLPMVS
jgi:NAD(P)-dependent dehydrogenase (short-subunit alcohol dehydrogenase family)